MRSAAQSPGSQEPEGIILEDDCLPSQSFFPYCVKLLKRFRDDERIMCITGCNFPQDMSGYPYSYIFQTMFVGLGDMAPL
jgi:hypothetical protein